MLGMSSSLLFGRKGNTPRILNRVFIFGLLKYE